MARPRLLLLDEPSLGLAPKIVADIFAVCTGSIRTGHGDADRRTECACGTEEHFAGLCLQVGKVACSGASAELRKDDQIMETYMGICA